MAKKFRVYSASGLHMADCYDIIAAGVLLAFEGEGATVKTGRTVLYTEGQDGRAGDSYDDFEQAILHALSRINEQQGGIRKRGR